MQAHTRKPLTDSGLVPLHFIVHSDNVERITKFVESVEPTEGGESLTLDEFFKSHFPGELQPAVCLHSARSRKAITQKQLAELTGIPQRHISEMEHSKRIIGKERAKLLSNALDTDYRLFL